MQRIYSKEVDNPSLRANQALCKTIPVAAKQSLKDNLRSYGFTGFKLADLTPNKTRRAQSCNWLLYYRDNLFGRTIEELLEEKRLRKEAEEKAIEERGNLLKLKPLKFRPSKYGTLNSLDPQYSSYV